MTFGGPNINHRIYIYELKSKCRNDKEKKKKKGLACCSSSTSNLSFIITFFKALNINKNYNLCDDGLQDQQIHSHELCNSHLSDIHNQRGSSFVFFIF